MKHKDTFSITNITRGRIPPLPFFDIKQAVLGKKYALSLVFIGSKRSLQLNRTYRHKNRPANILSFPLAKNEGEIFIDVQRARQETHSRRISYKMYIAQLYIHGLFHLKGYRHGSTMEKEEEKMRKKFLLRH